MGKKSYYTVDGLIEGERSGAATPNYLSDALGSVTTANGASNTTATYTPYGRGAPTSKPLSP